MSTTALQEDSKMTQDQETIESLEKALSDFNNSLKQLKESYNPNIKIKELDEVEKDIKSSKQLSKELENSDHIRIINNEDGSYGVEIRKGLIHRHCTIRPTAEIKFYIGDNKKTISSALSNFLKNAPSQSPEYHKFFKDLSNEISVEHSKIVESIKRLRDLFKSIRKEAKKHKSGNSEIGQFLARAKTQLDNEDWEGLGKTLSDLVDAVVKSINKKAEDTRAPSQVTPSSTTLPATPAPNRAPSNSVTIEIKPTFRRADYLDQLVWHRK